MEWLQEEWRRIPVDVLQTLVESIPEWLLLKPQEVAVRDSNGVATTEQTLRTEPTYLGYLPLLRPRNTGSMWTITVTRIKCAIALKCKAMNWRAVFPAFTHSATSVGKLRHRNGLCYDTTLRCTSCVKLGAVTEIAESVHWKSQNKGIVRADLRMALTASSRLTSANFFHRSKYDYADFGTRVSGVGFRFGRTPCCYFTHFSGTAATERFNCSPPTKAHWVQSGISQVGIVPDDVSGQRVFSGISRFSRTCILVLATTYSYHFTLIGSHDFVVKSRQNISTSQKQFSHIHKTPYDRVKRCQEHTQLKTCSAAQSSFLFNTLHCPACLELERRYRWLVCLPLTWTSRVRFPTESLPDFHTWESCRAVPLAGEFSQGSPVCPALAAPYLASLSLALPTSILRTAQISSLTRSAVSKMFASDGYIGNYSRALHWTLPKTFIDKMIWLLLQVL
ncbi:hypothetical protein PR048_015573 [Dryococelus australis]|uniref:Uncharacterized protein n=1 Tax=Dryococelus australis TaxID=614101 RepID=A0ABQ9HHK9_9NEOP|nr:hypothetical protein PR048_015573 [Dryococelus australis]